MRGGRETDEWRGKRKGSAFWSRAGILQLLWWASPPSYVRQLPSPHGAVRVAWVVQGTDAGVELLAEYVLGGVQPRVTPAFAPRDGEWTPIRLQVPEACEAPSEVREGQEDDRCLSMLFRALDVLVVETEA